MNKNVLPTKYQTSLEQRKIYRKVILYYFKFPDTLVPLRDFSGSLYYTSKLRVLDRQTDRYLVSNFWLFKTCRPLEKKRRREGKGAFLLWPQAKFACWTAFPQPVWCVFVSSTTFTQHLIRVRRSQMLALCAYPLVYMVQKVFVTF